jgi:hypothetical protein
MKKIFLILTSITISLLSSPIFAQGDPGDDPDFLEEVPAAPIDDYILIVALLGLAFVFLKVRNYIKQTNPLLK